MSPAASTSTSPALLERARALGAASVHEAAARRGDLPAGLLPVAGHFRVAGPAYTVSCATGDNLALHHALVQAPPGAVLVVAVDEGRPHGYWGQILSEAAHARGLGGLVINAAVRDVSQLGEIDFPVFATGVCLRGTVKDPARLRPAAAPIELAGVVVHTGDLVLGDTDGVVVIARDKAEEVIAAAEQRERDEVAIIARLRDGTSTIEVYALPAPPPLSDAEPDERR